MSLPALPEWLARELPFERTMVDVGDGQRMHVMQQRGAGPAILMVHGNPTWGFLYRKVAANLGGFRLIIPDLIGLGLSTKPEARLHTLENHGRWLGRLVDALAPGSLVFVGQDWGGPVGLLALATRRDLVAGMVILNTVVGPPRAGFRASAFHRFARLPVLSDLVFRGLSFPQAGLFAAQGSKTSILPWSVEGRAYRWVLRDRRANVAPLALARMVPDSASHPSIAPLERCEEFFRTFSGPIGIVWGDRDPVLGRVVTHLARLRPDAEVTRTQAGHFLQEEVPADIASAVRRVADLTRSARTSSHVSS